MKKLLLSFLASVIAWTLFGFSASAETVTDVITYNSLGLSQANSSYTAYTITDTESGAEYKLNCGANNNITINANTGYIATTKSPGIVKSVSVEIANNATLSIYAGNTAYTAAPTGTAVKTGLGNKDTYTFTDNYEYVAFKGSGSLQITKLTIVWETGTVTPPKPDTPSESELVDNISISNFTKVTGSYTYDTYTSETTGITYAACASKNNGMQINSTDGKGGLVVTKNDNGYIVKNIEITFSTVKDIDVYLNEKAYTYTSTADFGVTLDGTKTAKAITSSNTSYDVTNGTAFWGIKSNNGAAVISNIKVTYEASSSTDPDTPDPETPSGSSATATFDFSTISSITSNESDLANATNVLSDGITASFTKGNSGTPPAYNASYDEIRLYSGTSSAIAGNTISFSSDATMTKIEFPAGSNCTWGTVTASVGTATMDNNHNVTWTGNANDVTFTISRSNASTAAQWRFKDVTVTYIVKETAAVEAPEFTVEKGETSYTVKLSCATEGADIFYTTDGQEPTAQSTKYDNPIVLDKTTTIKAIAIKDGEQSRVVTKMVEVPLFATKIAQITEAYQGSDVNFVFTGKLTYVYQGTSGSNSYLYLTDGEDNILLFGYTDSTPTYKVGDTFTSLSGTYYLYNGLPEVKAGYTLSDATAGTEVIEPTVESIDGFFVADNLTKYVKFENVSISGVNGVNGTMTDADGKSAALYNRFGVAGFEDGENLTISGFVAVFNSNMQLYPTKIESSKVFAPKFSLENGTYYEGTELTITCDTEGATIVYTINDGEITEEVAPVTLFLTEDMSIEAYATLDGMTDSDVVEAEYTVKPIEGTSAMFNFSAEEFGNITCVPAINSYPGENATNIDNTVMTVNGVSLSFTKVASNGASLYESDHTLRTYTDNTITVSVPAQYYLTKVKFSRPNGTSNYKGFTVSNATRAADSVGEMNDAKDEWTNPVKTDYREVTFKAEGTNRIYSITVEFDDISTGVDEVAADSENAAVEYYNLQGVRVENPTTGLYIKRQGSTVTKVLVK